MLDKTFIKVASILDDFSYSCFKYECELIQLKADSWKETLINDKPDLLFVESAWNSDFKKLFNKHAANGNGLSEAANMINWCKEHNIPTVFWNKEDPIHFKHFISAAKLFDYIFTTDINSIPDYKKVVGHDNIYLLLFAAQPKIHNPIDKDKETLGNVAFAGTWYSHRPKRRKDMEALFDSVSRYTLHIYDRKYYEKNKTYRFPDTYKPCVRPSLQYEHMVSVYKKYDIFLNVNTVDNSPTMCARRVFELLACGTNVVSSQSTAIKNLFPGIVKLHKTKKNTAKYINRLIYNKDLRDRLSLMGQREIWNNHTYAHRMRTILEKTCLSRKKEDKPGVSIIACVNESDHIERVFANYGRQNHIKKELILVINGRNPDMEKRIENEMQYKDIKIIRIGAQIQLSLEKCFCHAAGFASFDHISMFDANSYYSPEFLGDLLNAFIYSDADTAATGKCAYHVYQEYSCSLILKFQNIENRYTNFLPLSTSIIRKEKLDDIEYITGSDNQEIFLYKKHGESNIKLYSADRFNYARISNAPESFYFVAHTYNYPAYITVGEKSDY